MLPTVLSPSRARQSHPGRPPPGAQGPALVGHKGHPFSRTSPEWGPGQGRRRDRPRNAVPSGDRIPPRLSPTRPAAPAPAGLRGAESKQWVERLSRTRQPRGGGAAPGVRVVAATRGQQRPVGGGDRAEASGDRGGIGSWRRRLRDANSAGAEPGASDRHRRRPPSPAERTRERDCHPFGRPGVVGTGGSIPSSGRRQEGRRAAAAAGGARPPRGSQQWCSALARSPRPPRGRRGSGRETPPATRSPEFARLASPAGAPLAPSLARQRPRRLSPEHGAGARLSLIALLLPPLVPPVPRVPPEGAASGSSARGECNSLPLQGDRPVATRPELAH